MNPGNGGHEAQSERDATRVDFLMSCGKTRLAKTSTCILNADRRDGGDFSAGRGAKRCGRRGGGDIAAVHGCSVSLSKVVIDGIAASPPCGVAKV